MEWDFYQKQIGGQLEPVKESLKIIAKNRNKTWLEVCNLLVPGQNDSVKELKEMCAFLAKDIGKDVPLHFTRFKPEYQMKNLPLTPQSVLETAHKIAKDAGLEYVYLGNLGGHEAENTFCPKCGKKVIERLNFTTLKNTLTAGKCSCGYQLPGVWI